MPYSNDPVVKRCRRRFSWPNFKFADKPVLPEPEPEPIPFLFGTIHREIWKTKEKKVEEYWNKKIS